jgi:LacI family transcriptional regulator
MQRNETLARLRKAMTKPAPGNKPIPIRPRATLREVAREAGVSVMTVSNVINDKHHLMSGETRQCVYAAIDKLGYRPHSRARSLRLSHEFSIGLLIVDPSPSFLTDAFTTHVVAGLSNYLNQRGYALLIQGIASESVKETPMLRHHRTDAICLMVSGDAATRRAIYRILEAAGQPAVILQEEVPDFLGDAISVRQDDRGGGAMLARHVLAQGCRHIVYLKEAHSWPALENRERGVYAAVAEVNGKAVSLSCETAGIIDAQATFAAYVEEHGLPDAVLAANDQIGIAVLKWLAEQRIAVPGQIRVTGFNAFDFWQFATPTLTTVRSPAYALGETAAANLLQRLKVGHFLQRDVILAVGLEPGGSA